MVGDKEYPEGTGRNKREAKEAAAELACLQIKGTEVSEVCENRHKFFIEALFTKIITILKKMSTSTAQQSLKQYLVKEWLNNFFTELRPRLVRRGGGSQAVHAMRNLVSPSSQISGEE